MDIASRIVRTILDMNPRPTAVFVGYDILAYWICAQLEGAGVQIPSQMSVVGFDWRAGRGGTPVDELTTASQDFEGFGRHAANLMLDRVEGGIPRQSRHVLLDAPLVIRSSTAHNLAQPDYPANEERGLLAPEIIYET